jgi:hypothetical protein
MAPTGTALVYPLRADRDGAAAAAGPQERAFREKVKARKTSPPSSPEGKATPASSPVATPTTPVTLPRDLGHACVGHPREIEARTGAPVAALDFSEFARTCDTGTVLLAGLAPAKAAELGHGSDPALTPTEGRAFYSHAAVIVRDPPADITTMYHCPVCAAAKPGGAYALVCGDGGETRLLPLRELVRLWMHGGGIGGAADEADWALSARRVCFGLGLAGELVPLQAADASAGASAEHSGTATAAPALLRHQQLWEWVRAACSSASGAHDSPPPQLMQLSGLGLSQEEKGEENGQGGEHGGDRSKKEQAEERAEAEQKRAATVAQCLQRLGVLGEGVEGVALATVTPLDFVPGHAVDRGLAPGFSLDFVELRGASECLAASSAAAALRPTVVGPVVVAHAALGMSTPTRKRKNDLVPLAAAACMVVQVSPIGNQGSLTCF